MIYHCCVEKRLEAVRLHGGFNGIEYLEVVDRDLPETDALRQRTLLVRCLLPVAGLGADQVRIEGGERVRDIAVEWAAPATPPPQQLVAPDPPDTPALEASTLAVVQAVADPATLLVVRVSVAGDFSTYRLRLVAGALDDAPAPGFDSRLCEIEFRFKVECPSEFDCKVDPACLAPARAAPEIDYLARDFGSIRRLLLDRLAATVPAWSQSSVADTGVALAELLAFVGDRLSYWQDAIATEAYLETARRRVSLRRHATLVDYAMHDGCNARAFVHVEVRPEVGALDLPATGVQFLTRCPGLPPVLAPGSAALAAALQTGPAVFEPLHAATLHAEHDEIAFYTWSDERCCLPAGATQATLTGHLPDLKVGDALLLEEVLGPRTGAPGDADPSHRHIVRLSSVLPDDPAVTLTDPLTGEAITEIEWHAEDALPFPLCVSAVTDELHGSQALEKVSVARGNLVLVDHGATGEPADLGRVPAPRLFLAPACAGAGCDPPPPAPVPPRFRPRLAQAPLTQAGTVRIAPPAGSSAAAQRAAFDPAASAAAALRWDMVDVLPRIALQSQQEAQTTDWTPHRTLLESAADAPDFVVEVEDDGSARLRFGDDARGQRPDAGAEFTATYRVGNGTAGNVGAESIAHVVGGAAAADAIASVRNPLPAVGGLDPETSASVRRSAPEAFRTQRRAVTTDDYATVTQAFGGIQRAAATLRWTGSWYTVFNTVDREGGQPLTAALEADLARHVDRFRMAGHDLEFDDPVFVPLELGLHVCVADDYFRADVKRALLEVFSNRLLPDGRRGLFHQDAFSFGQTVWLSPLYAAAHAVPGVASVEVTAFRRQGDTDDAALLAGRIELGRLEIARLDNDPNSPERGVLHIDLHGGK